MRLDGAIDGQTLLPGTQFHAGLVGERPLHRLDEEEAPSTNQSMASREWSRVSLAGPWDDLRIVSSPLFAPMNRGLES